MKGTVIGVSLNTTPEWLTVDIKLDKGAGELVLVQPKADGLTIGARVSVAVTADDLDGTCV